MTTTIPHTAQQEIVQADQLRPGQVVRDHADPEDAWREVAAAESVLACNGASVTILWRGGEIFPAHHQRRYVVADDATAAAWRDEQQQVVARNQLAADLHDLADRYARGDLTPPPSYSHVDIAVCLTAETEVVHDADTLGAEVEHPDNRSVRAEATLRRLRLRLFAFERKEPGDAAQ